MKRRELRVIRKSERYNFTVGAIVDSLQGAGVPTDEAIDIARAIEKHYRSHDVKNIALDDLVRRIGKMLEAKVGAEYAERFLQQTPPFVPIMVETAEGKTPFSRRKLAASLEKLELSFKVAHSLATQVGQQLRRQGSESIGERNLIHLTAMSLETLLGREMRLRYEAKTRQPSDLRVLESDGVYLPYSRGILAQSLSALGLGPELSHHLAKRAKEMLWRSGQLEVSRSQLRAAVRSLLVEEAGEEFARRYDLMQSIRRPEQPIIILIGGAPGVGKSSLATELAYRLGIPRVVPSDSVRQALRSLISADLSPTLHSSSYLAWRAELLPSERETAEAKPKRVVRAFQMQVQQLGTALSAIVSRSIIEQASLVVEGIHLVPGFMPQEQFPNATVIELVVAVQNPDIHRNHFSLREAQTRNYRHSERYLDHFEEIRFIQDFMLSQAEQEGVPVVEASDFDAAVDQALELVLNAVLLEQGEEETADKIEPA